MAKRTLVSALFRIARTADDVSTFASSDPKPIERRAKNELIGRALGRAGVWQRLWR